MYELVSSKLSDFDYELPKGLIAQEPVLDRAEARLLVLNRASQTMEHRIFRQITGYLQAGDVLVLNDTKVLPARLFGKRKTGARVEILLLKHYSVRADNDEVWEVLVKPSRRVHEGETIIFGSDSAVTAQILDAPGQRTGIRRLRFETNTSPSPSPLPLEGGEGKGEGVESSSNLGNSAIEALLNRVGRIPLPPYIDREDTPLDRELYQTVFAKCPGAVASPTAGLHFDQALLDEIRAKGVEIVFVTLHVSYGTFQAVQSDDLGQHKMYEEYFEVPEETARVINLAQSDGRRIIACGTTVIRSLESAARGSVPAEVKSTRGETNLFIYPPYEFKIVDCMITNFHLPRTTLLMLTSAFTGHELLMRAYREAIDERYRFYSYGDAMLIL